MASTNIDRCPTGISGLDELMGGGFPRGRNILLSGACGTGKTTFAVEFLYNGIVKYNEPGILVTMEQNPQEVRQDMLKYGFDLEKLEKDGKLVIIDISLSRFCVTDITTTERRKDRSFSLTKMELSDVMNVIQNIIDTADQIKAERVVIDSLPALYSLVKIKENLREALFRMNYLLKLGGLTSILISEAPEHDGISMASVEEYVSDGVILLGVNETLDTRTVKIRKMRLTKHSLKPKTLELTVKGAIVS